MTAPRDPKLDSVLTASPAVAWQAVFDKLQEVFSAPLTLQHAEREVMERERKVGDLELLLSGSAWDLWQEFESSAPRTSKALIEFWNATSSGRAVLILDGLSLREMPWLSAISVIVTGWARLSHPAQYMSTRKEKSVHWVSRIVM